MGIRLSPSLLTWLRSFDAAARHGSFTKAAAELCITQGAVSQQVKQLEDWLRRPLFLRTPRALVPTPEGKWLAVVLRESFDAIESTLAQMRQPAEAATATLSCSPSFAMSWLTPRLGDFFRQHPHTGLRVFGEFHTLDRTRMVRDGVEALDFLFSTGTHAGRDPNDLPTIVLLDLKLPRLDGLEVLKRMRANEKTKLLPVIVLTSSREQQDLVTSYSLGANSYIRKPVDFEQFVWAVKQVGLYWLVLNQSPELPTG